MIDNYVENIVYHISESSNNQHNLEIKIEENCYYGTQNCCESVDRVIIIIKLLSTLFRVISEGSEFYITTTNTW